jgi:protein-S-isoprenylcysteine O-methyltransferase Ste14
MLLKQLEFFIEKIHLDLIIFFVLSILLFIFYFSFDYLKFFGILISFIGFFIWIFGLCSLGKSFMIQAKAKALVTTGIYSKIRHPIYLGNLFVEVGWIFYSINTQFFLISIIVVLVTFILQIPRILIEEKVLAKKFKRKYFDYKSGTWI